MDKVLCAAARGFGFLKLGEPETPAAPPLLWRRRQIKKALKQRGKSGGGAVADEDAADAAAADAADADTEPADTDPTDTDAGTDAVHTACSADASPKKQK